MNDIRKHHGVAAVEQPGNPVVNGDCPVPPDELTRMRTKFDEVMLETILHIGRPAV